MSSVQQALQELVEPGLWVAGLSTRMYQEPLRFKDSQGALRPPCPAHPPGSGLRPERTQCGSPGPPPARLPPPNLGLPCSQRKEGSGVGGGGAKEQDGCLGHGQAEAGG